MRYLKNSCCVLLLMLPGINAFCQQLQVQVLPKQQSVEVTIGGKPFTTYLFPDSLSKPVLYPIYAADNQIVTRGFPIDTRPGEPTDHPHQLGCWLTYENVNGIDFWNNSYAIPADKKFRYGWIKTKKILETSGGKTGKLMVLANWQKQDGRVLLEEKTTFLFSGTANSRTIDRMTTLTAQEDTVRFFDVKDGLFGLRVTKALQLPEKDQPANEPEQPSGNYLTSAGKTGNAAWGSRAKWCMLYGVKLKDTIALCIFGHPENPGYPAYWHARGYGLFAANPIAHKAYDALQEKHELVIAPGESVTFRYRLNIISGQVPDTASLNEEAENFAGE